MPLLRFVVVAILFAATLSAGDRPTLEDLDAIIVEAGSVQGFLSPENEALRDRYYQGLKNYYGGKFSRDSYDAVLKQMRELVKEVPEVAERLWQDNKTGNIGVEIVLESALESRGVGIDPQVLNAYLTSFQERLGASQDVLNSKSEAAKEIEVGAILKNVADRLEKMESEAAALSKKKAEALRAETYRTIRSNKEVSAALAYVVSEKIASENIQDILRTGDPEVILDNWEAMREFPRQQQWHPRIKIPEQTKSLLRDVLPRVGELTSATVEGKPVFPKTTFESRRGKAVEAGRLDMSEVRFRPVPRRIHGVWKGAAPPIQECIGGACDSLEGLTPNRWATVALKDSQLYHVETKGKYHGFVQLQPVVARGQIVASVDLASPVLSRKVKVKGAKIPLANLWVKQAVKVLPTSWGGIVTSDSDEIDNAGVKSSLFRSTPYILGDYVASSATVADPLAEKIPKAGIGHDRLYGKKMIFDAVMSDSGELVRLNPNAQEELDVSSILDRLRKSMSKRQRAFITGFAIRNLSEDQKNEHFPLLYEAAARVDQPGPMSLLNRERVAKEFLARRDAGEPFFSQELPNFVSFASAYHSQLPAEIQDRINQQMWRWVILESFVDHELSSSAQNLYGKSRGFARDSFRRFLVDLSPEELSEAWAKERFDFYLSSYLQNLRDLTPEEGASLLALLEAGVLKQSKHSVLDSLDLLLTDASESVTNRKLRIAINKVKKKMGKLTWYRNPDTIELCQKVMRALARRQNKE